MDTSVFTTVRLGKSSVSDIKALNATPSGLVMTPLLLNVVCTQVPAECAVDNYVFIWLGSDNNKGAATEWKQGFKAFGQITALNRGTSWNDNTTTTIRVLFVFSDAITRLDLLKLAPEEYYYCSSAPIIGLDDHSNQTIRMFETRSDRCDINAFFRALDIVSPGFKKDILTAVPSLETLFSFVSHKSIVKGNNSQINGQQVVYYGAPGTGKSYTLNQDTKGADIIRTTFHPDSDYSSFVGAYKPVEVSVQKTYLTYDSAMKRAIEVPVYDMMGKTEVQEKKITYKFVQQAFLKAYIKAWKKISTTTPKASNPSENSIAITYPGTKATITIVSIDDQQLTLRKIEKFNKTIVESSWNKLWGSGVFKYPHGTRPGTSIQDAIAIWIYENSSKVKTDFSAGWDFLLDCCRQNKTVDTKPGSQTYTISSIDGVQDSVNITSYQPKMKENVRWLFLGGKKPRGVEKGIVDKLKEYSPKDFNDAWLKLVNAVSQMPASNPTSGQSSTENSLYLIIEEINRGDCAQVFGDIFQLLDRNEKGFSSYPIEADSDIQRELKNEFAQLTIPQEVDSLYADPVGNPINYYWEENGIQRRGTTSDAIKEGRILVIPSNLYIYATMNTSDQSLFPMDSAFKRRWEWKYFPIMNEGKNYKVVVDKTHQYDWWETIDTLNRKIYNVSKSADKQLGYWFAKPREGTRIDAKSFVSKVIFYLWNDVFKDYGFDSNNAFSHDVQFGNFFKSDGEINVDTVIKFIEKNSINNEIKQEDTPETGIANSEP